MEKVLGGVVAVPKVALGLVFLLGVALLSERLSDTRDSTVYF